MVTAFDENGENGDIGWINAGNASSLRKILRTVFLQLLTALKSNRQTFVIIKPLRNLNVFIQLRPFRRFLLLFDIRRIMTHNIYFIRNAPFYVFI